MLEHKKAGVNNNNIMPHVCGVKQNTFVLLTIVGDEFTAYSLYNLSLNRQPTALVAQE
jgi:hypothetical protein